MQPQRQSQACMKCRVKIFLKTQKINFMSNKHYWVSYERGEGDPFEASSLSEVKRIITGKMNHVLTEDGRVAGGYKLHRSNGRVIHSGGEFRLINGKVKYFPDYIEEY